MDIGEIDEEFDTIERCLGVLASGSPDRTTESEWLHMVDRYEKLTRLAFAAQRLPLARLAEAGPEAFGGERLKAVIANRLRLTPAQAGHRLDHTADLTPRLSFTGQDLPPVLAHTAQAEQHGLIGREHITVIREFFHHLPADVDHRHRDNAEKRLTDLSLTMRPDEVKATAKRIAAHLNPDGEFTERDRARKRSFRMGAQGVDKMRTGSFCVTPEVGAYLETIFAKLAAPGMCNPDDGRASTIDGVPDPDAARRDQRTPAQRCHDALAAICRDALASDRLGSHRGLPVTIIATATVHDLQQQAGIATTAGGSLLPIRDLITMAGRTRHYLAIFDDHDSRPLYLGRAKRLATTDQRLLLCATDRGCTFPGCSMPASMSDVHHLREWADGGTTDITNLTLVCPTHHQLAGSGPHRWRTTKSSGGRTRWTPPRHLDPNCKPRTNSYHHPEQPLSESPTRPP
ncbi:HNH endonuclease signature motif containing protein [Millisia brevis]|uniref:HNH endonuclease signature motif containing protein n=1 Tax=Millisia brevis TaxID=264148 RepID=UPI0008378E39|nr:HNH endonuclease signature motif containing protein [Millisia brevis]